MRGIVSEWKSLGFNQQQALLGIQSGKLGVQVSASDYFINGVKVWGIGPKRTVLSLLKRQLVKLDSDGAIRLTLRGVDVVNAKGE